MGLEVAWGWSTDGRWQATEDARFEFAGRGLLYKIYINRVLPPGTDVDVSDPNVELLSSLAPVARMALTGANP
jgi:hypothetical protein